MKKLFVVSLFLLMSLPSFAQLGPDSSWSEIEKSSDHIVVYPNFGLPVSVAHYFLDGDMLVTSKKRAVCNEWSYGENAECINYIYVSADSPRTMTKNRCVAWDEYGDNSGDCLQWGKVEVTVPETFEVAVMLLPTSGEADPVLDFYKEYSIPSVH